MAQAPRFGETIVRGGKTYRRIIDGVQVDAGVAAKTHGYPYVSNALPRTQRGKPNGYPAGTKFDPKGRPVIRSQRHEKEVCAAGGLTRD